VRACVCVYVCISISLLNMFALHSLVVCVHTPYYAFIPSRFWWEFVVLSRRSIIIALMFLTTLERSVRFSYVSVGNIACLVLHAVMLPFNTARDNVLEIVSLAFLTLMSVGLSTTQVPNRTRNFLHASTIQCYTHTYNMHQHMKPTLS